MHNKLFLKELTNILIALAIYSLLHNIISISLAAKTAYSESKDAYGIYYGRDSFFLWFAPSYFGVLKYTWYMPIFIYAGIKWFKLKSLKNK